MFGGPSRAHDADDGPGAGDGDERDQADGGDGERDELGDVARAAVLGFGGLDDLGHENRVEHATGNEHVDEVGEGVCGFEDVTDGRE